MKKVLFALALIFISVQLCANAFNLGGFIKNSAVQSLQSSQQTTSQTAKTSSAVNPFASLNSQLASVNTQTQNSFLKAVSMLSSKQESDIIQYKINSIINNTEKTEAEKSSLITEIMTTYANDISGVKSNSALTSIKNMSGAEKQNLANTVTALSQNGASYFALAKNYTKTASTMAKASSSIQETANTIASAKQAAAALKENATAISVLTSNITSLLKQAN